MNVNEAIKAIKIELKKVKEENKKFKNEDVKKHVKEVELWVIELINMRDSMLDLSNPNGPDYRTSMITSVNFCLDWVSSCYLFMFLNCGSISEYNEYEKTRDFYKNEQKRIESLKI